MTPTGTSYVSPELAAFLGGLPLWVKIGWAIAMLLFTTAAVMLRRYK